LPYGDDVDAEGQLVTLRQLLSHSAGLTPGGFPGYERGDQLPTLPQILDGVPPATNAPARVVAEPGAGVAYSGLGYMIIQLALVDQLGRPFPEIMNDIVLLPLGLSSSTFSQTPTEAFSSRAASGHDVSGAVIEGDWRVYPEMAAAGMWTTPSDLAAILIEVAKSKTGDANRILSVEMTALMLQREKEHMGLGFVIGREAGTRFSHSGGNEGFRCHMRMYADTGKGIVIMSNSDNGGHLFSPLMTAVAREYGWSSFEPQEVPRHVALGILERIEGPAVVIDAAILAEYVGRYELAPGFVFDVAVMDRQLKIKLGDQPGLTVTRSRPTSSTTKRSTHRLHSCAMSPATCPR
jgi:CubicO group peptidase (beta-lactamase class C family)